jgi:hypothetical protein
VFEQTAWPPASPDATAGAADLARNTLQTALPDEDVAFLARKKSASTPVARLGGRSILL